MNKFMGMPLISLVKDQKVHFSFYRDKELWYENDMGFVFPVPLTDVGTATFLRDDKAILFMRYIRKYWEELKNEQDSRQNAVL